jgi:hypothetical protein
VACSSPSPPRSSLACARGERWGRVEPGVDGAGLDDGYVSEFVAELDEGVDDITKALGTRVTKPADGPRNSGKYLGAPPSPGRAGR